MLRVPPLVVGLSLCVLGYAIEALVQLPNSSNVLARDQAEDELRSAQVSSAPEAR